MKTQTPQKAQTKSDQGELKFNKIEKIFVTPEASNKYSTSSENALYILTDKNTFLVFEKNSTNKNYLQLKIDQYIKKDESKLQTKEYSNQIWTDDLGNHVIIKTNGNLFYYNPYFKNDINLKEILLEYNSKFYLEPYSIAFNEEIKSQDEFEILLADYNSEIYNIKIKIIDKKEIKIDYFEKVLSFKSKFELEQEKYLFQDKNEYEKEKEKFKDEDKDEFDLEMDLDELNMISFEKGERIIDMKIYNDKNNEKIVIACTKNMVFKFVGKEQTFSEFFKKYSGNSEILQKSYRKFPNLSNSLGYNKTHLQILPSYTTTKTEKIVFGCLGGYGYCMGELEDNFENKEKEENDLGNIFVINFRRPKYLGESKIPLFTLDEKLLNSRINSEPIMACQSKLHIFILYDNCLLTINKITQRYINSYKLSIKFIGMFYNKFKNCIFLYTEKEIYNFPLDGEDKYTWMNYIEIGRFDLALNSISKDDDEKRAIIHKLKADYLYKQKKYELAGKEYSFSNEPFEHICYKFLRDGKLSGLISYLEMIKTHKLNDINIRNFNNEFFINKYLVYTWLAELLLNEENNKNKNNELIQKKFTEEFKHNRKDKYINKQNLYHFLRINGKEKEFNEFAILKNDHKALIENLLIKGKYNEAFNYLEKNLANENNNTEECTKILMQYIDLFMKKSIKNTVKLFENITFSLNDQKQIVRAIMGSNYKNCIDDENNYNIILNYLRKIIKQNISSEMQNKNLNNLYILFLSLSDKKENKEEIVEYLKGPLNIYTLNNNQMNISFTNKKVLIDLGFAENILKNNPPALSLVYFLMQKYDECIKIALDNEEYELAIIMTQNIPNEEKQRKIWIKIFIYFNKKKIYSPKYILELSNGVLNIEDILPLMDDEIKLQDIKLDLQECIDVYEEGVSQLKQKIISYNKSNRNIQQDIYAINKRRLDLEHSKIKCYECENNISDNKFFLFPCGHVFDADCLVKILIDYDDNGIGGEELSLKVKAIKNLTDKIMNMQRKKSFHKKNIFMGGLSKFKKKTKKTMKMFLTFVKNEQKLAEKGKLIEKEREKEKEKGKLFIEEETDLTKEEELQLKELTIGLYNLLKDECVLCGQEMINSTQIYFSKDDENKKWGKLVE